jgi:PAS domain S-box-containing protein
MDAPARPSGLPTAGDDGVRTDQPTTADRLRFVAQLNMLHSLAAKLNALGDVKEIGHAIAGELRTIIDYHSCRVYLLEPDGHTLGPIAYRGDLFSEYEHETYEELVTQVGEGITGHVAETGRSLLTADARDVEFAVQIPGTDDILESMLAVPMLIGDRAIGVIVLSMLGYGRFDEEDRRLLEVLASHAAVAFENAKLLEAEREAALTSTALLRLSQALTQQNTVDAIFGEALETIPSLVACSALGAYLRDEESGAFRPVRLVDIDRDQARPKEDVAEVPEEVTAPFLGRDLAPFVVPREIVGRVPRELWLARDAREMLIAPLRWEPDGLGALALAAVDRESEFTERDLRLARGIADITSLALGTARRMTELERFHELVETLDAVFWEAEANSRRLTFVGGRAERLLAEDAAAWPSLGRAWGEHILEHDRPQAEAEIGRAVADGRDGSLEYRVVAPDGRTAWIRDLVHVTRGRRGLRLLRGLMVDITERKRAEEALRRSERKYSESFQREREASQRLRALDEMKNTFLEAVSHDLRTPLTSILGSALTLGRTDLELPREDAMDLVNRIATNARKLERLLTDLLDLDRLQRGIVTPQRLPTDLRALVHRSLEQAEHADPARIEVDAEPVTVSVDAAKVERILENLLNNAVRHAPEGTRIWVRAHAVDGGALLTVEDDGPGVPPELREAVFEPFRQAPGSSSGHSPGVGVGLSLVQRFAELHGGRAWLEERAGGGASFKVFLPNG